MARELHIIGPPGTGKTTYCASRSRLAAEAYGPDRVLFLSLTKAAAREAAGRDTPLPPQNMGTLHAICHRVLGRPQLLAPAHIREWNALHPQWELPPDIVTGDESDEAPAEPRGASIYAEYQLARARMVDRRIWRDGLRAFSVEFESFKESGDLHDFTDLIERAYHEVPLPPGGAQLIIADEYQDFSRLENSVLRRWAQHARDLVLAGDPLQAIYEWRGADPEGFHNPDAERRILCETTPSYRCPRAVWQKATDFAADLLKAEGVSYLPRDADGAVERAAGINAWSPNGGPPGMLVATCRQFLHPLIKKLRDQGIPYHNPYARGWNPLRPTGTLGTLLSLSAPGEHWSWADLRRFIPHLGSECFRGPKVGAVEAIPADDSPWSWDVMRLWLTTHLHPLVIDGLLNCLESSDPTWYVGETVASWQKWTPYPLEVVRRVGARELARQVALPPRERPWWGVGTVHCSPPDELILTKRGEVPISELVEDDRLVGFDIKTHRFAGFGNDNRSKGYSFERSRRPYCGNLVTITSELTRTRVTSNHRVLARLADNFFGKYVVYLMKRGDWWRVGFCVSGHRPYKSGGVAGRLATEQADAGWILAVCKTREEAVIAEAKVQAIYGIPGLTFERSCSARTLLSEEMHKIYDMAAPFVAPRAHSLLLHAGSHPDWPLYRRGNGWKKNMRTTFTVEAGTLMPLSGYINLPRFNSKHYITAKRGQSRRPVKVLRPDWVLGHLSMEHYEGIVYGIEVPPHHHYVSGGVVVHNSYKGGEGDRVFLWPDLSRPYHEQAKRPGWHGRDALVRLFYVAMTRARETLYIGVGGRLRFPL